MSNEPSGISIQKPVSLWNRPLRIQPRETLAGLARTAINGFKGDVDDALEGLVSAFVDTDLDSDAGQLAWALIYAALMRAIAEVLKDASDLFERLQGGGDAQSSSSGQQTETKLARLSGILEDHLHHCDALIDDGFFSHPERFALLEDFRPGFEHWLEGLGLETASARGLGQRLVSQFPLALHEEWRRRPDHYEPILRALNSPFAIALAREQQWRQHRAWLDAQVDQRMFGEAFGLRQVYVPLRAYYEEQDSTDIGSDDDGQEVGALSAQRMDQRRIRHAFDLHQSLHGWVEQFDPNDTVRLVSGGPGSGKSSFARMFATEIASGLGLKVLFIPLHLLQIRDDLVRAVGQYAEADRWLRGNPLDGGGEHRLIIIFDGLDELSMQGASASEAAQSFVEQVLRLAGQFSAQGMQRQFVITGRELSIQANAGRLCRPEQVFHVLPFLVDKGEQGIAWHDPEGLLDTDQRDDWWRRYGQASGQAFESMPEELRGDDLADITRQPLLNYLVALSHRRGRVSFGAAMNLNLVYADLLSAVYERQYERRRHLAIAQINFQVFERLLEEIALSIWHGSGRTATDSEISERCRQSGLGPLLEVFRQGAEKGVTRLLTAFYFRQANQLGGEKTFEFTHKSFGEYLTARRLVRALQRIQTQLERRSEDPEDGWDQRAALRHVAEVAGPTAMDGYIEAFVRREVECRGRDTCIRWQRSLARLIEFSVTHGLPMEEFTTLKYPEMARQARNVDETLLVLHSASATVTEAVVPIRWPEPTAFGAWLKRLQGQRPGPVTSPCMRSMNYLALQYQVLDIVDLWGGALCGVRLNSARLPLANLRRANLNGADLSESNLSEAQLDAAYLRASNLRKASLCRASLRGAYLDEASLLAADLSAADLINAGLSQADLREASLRKANLSGAHLFKAGLLSADLGEADMRGADLTMADLRQANLSGADLREANLSGADLREANLSGADLREANLSEADLSEANLIGADLSEANLIGARLSEADLRESNLTGAHLDSTTRLT
ncbi:pentapeptide repeat-containing protein [Marichromatium sp. AB31]|uniref:pentapeptide repeat-containing protein n=1 Tax=Marichromatium sp. AB31 TaxID=2483362 RepID=UPI000F3FAD2A|nr:pentapeptide repeat-containing protein [Marichromatium sp. AB31]RNE88600.1 pentapeptide repeat-containing protein [Marichromatium sp. AB31]